MLIQIQSSHFAAATLALTMWRALRSNTHHPHWSDLEGMRISYNSEAVVKPKTTRGILKSYTRASWGGASLLLAMVSRGDSGGSRIGGHPPL